MKRFAAVILMMLCIGVAVADESKPAISSKVTEGLTTATFYDFKSNDLFYGGITSLLSWQDYLSIDAGIVTANTQKMAVIGGLGINFGKIFKSIGFDVNKILESARVGGYMGKYMEESLQLDMYGVYVGTFIEF